MCGRMFRQQFTKLDAFGVQDCGLTGDSCGQPLFSHKPSYWWKSEFLARMCTCKCKMAHALRSVVAGMRAGVQNVQALVCSDRGMIWH